MRCNSSIILPSKKNRLIEKDIKMMMMMIITIMKKKFYFIYYLLYFPRNDDNYVVWSAILSHLNEMAGLLALESSYTDFTNFVLDLLGDRAMKLGWTPSEEETHNERLLRSSIMFAAVEYGYANAVTTGMDLFKQNMGNNGMIKNPTDIHPDIRGAIYKAAVSKGGREEYDWVLARYQREDVSASEKVKCLYALAYSEEHSLLQKNIGTRY